MEIFLYKGDLPDSLLFDNVNAIAVDTEAMGLLHNRGRDRLCLVQLSTGDGNAYLVQLKNNYQQAVNLKRILQNENVTKIFHFARFDMSIIYYYLEVLTVPCYCTKIASRLVRTYTDNHSLQGLCSELLNTKLNKQQQCSDWGNEDLTERQKRYAASDVLYLHEIKKKLDFMLERENRKGLAQECFKFLPTRIKLDLMGWEDVDIFNYQI